MTKEQDTSDPYCYEHMVEKYKTVDGKFLCPLCNAREYAENVEFYIVKDDGKNR
jgi:hypothetical protein